MLVATGFFDNGNPSLKFQLSGVFNQTPVEFTAIIDTGFTGFIAMPLIKAFPLGLPLFGTTQVTLADGQTQTKLVAQARATIGSQTKIGIVILEPSSSDILIGMDFLRTFKLALFVTSTGIVLLDEGAFEKMARDAAATKPEEAAAKPKPAGTLQAPQKP